MPYNQDSICSVLLKKPEYDITESEDQTPSIDKIYRLVQELSLKVIKLEKENVKLKQNVLKKQKLNILEYLNNQIIENQPNLLFNEWINKVVLSHVKNSLECVFKEDLIMGIVDTWEHAIKDITIVIPIKTYINRPNVFYIYTEDDGNRLWKQLHIEDMNRQLLKICQQFVVEFKKGWYEPNEEKIDIDEKWTNMYVDYYKRILGGSKITTEVICQRVRSRIYTLMKKDFENIV
jgi:hypothetical protein